MGTIQVVCDFEFICSKTWNDLQEISGQTSVRYCNECSKPVFLCTSYQELKIHAQKSNCVALQPPNQRALLGSLRRTPRPGY